MRPRSTISSPSGIGASNSATTNAKTYEPRSTPYAHATPDTAITTPAIAGPTIEPTCQPAWFNADAAGISLSDKRRGIAAWRAGPWIAARNHVPRFAAWSNHSGGCPDSAPKNKMAATTIDASCVQIRVVRRS